MRIFPILTAIVVAAILFLLIFERQSVLEFAGAGGDEAAEAETGTDADTSGEAGLVGVVALHSAAREIDSAVVLRGRTEAAREVQLRSETSGLVVSEPLRKGYFVKQGEALCRLDPGTREVSLAEAEARLAEARARVPEAEARIAEAQSRVPAAEAALVDAEAAMPVARARVIEAEARLSEAEIGYNAASKLAEEGYASETRVAAAEAGLQAARAGVEQAKSQLESTRARVSSARSQVTGAEAGVKTALSGVANAEAGIQAAEAGVAAARREIERLVITAPFAGLLESDTAELGSLMQPGALCATVIQLDPVKLVGFVPEVEVDRVKIGALAGARLATGAEVTGKVVFLSRSADQVTRTFRVEVEVPNADLSIRDGQTADILIQADGQMAHLLPSSALTLDNAGTLGLRIVTEGNIVEFAPVRVIRDTTAGVWVAGLPDIADVIVVGQEYVSPGTRVRVTWREPDA